MKKIAPLALCTLMLIASTACALETPPASAPEVKTETQADVAQTQTTTETSKESKEASQTGAATNSDSSAQSQASPTLESPAAQDKLPAAAPGEKSATGQETAAPSNNVQKLFSMFHPKQQADAQQQEAAPTPTQNNQTSQ